VRAAAVIVINIGGKRDESNETGVSLLGWLWPAEAVSLAASAGRK